MKKTIASLMILTSCLLLVSCAENANNANSTTQNQTQNGQTDVQNVEQNDTLIIAYPSGGNTLNPTRATDSTSAVFVNATYDQLVTYGSTTNADGLEIANTSDIQPSLAKSWEISEDNLTYTITLDETATFSNGDKVDADAVIYSLNRIKNSNYTGFLYTLANIETMTAIDENTVEFTLSKPCTIFFNLLQMHIFSIVNPNELVDMTEEQIDEFLTTNTVGSGAYSIESWDATTESILKSREDYWKGEVDIKEVVVQVMAEASNRVLFTKNGDVDVAMSVPANDLSSFDGVSTVEVKDYESVAVVYLSLNTTQAPFDNELVRQALSYAIPYDSIVADIMGGKATKLDHVVPKIMPAYLDSSEGVYNQDLDKARELLAEAGYSDGLELSITISSSSKEDEDVAILLESVLSEIGISLNINKMERAQYLEAIRGANFDFAVASYSAFVNDPGYYFGNVLYSKGEYNYGKYASEGVDAIWDKAESSADLAERYELYKEAQLIVAEEAGIVPLYEKSNIVVFNDTVSRYKHYPDGAVRFAEMSMK